MRPAILIAASWFLTAWPTSASAQTAPPYIAPQQSPAPWSAPQGQPNQFRPDESARPLNSTSQPQRDPAVHPASVEQPVPMKPRSATEARDRLNAPRSTPSIGTTVASLMLVLGIFLTAAWVLRRGLPRGAGLLPLDVIEVLGRTPLAARQQAHLIKLGNKLLLVSVSPGGAETLAEVTDPIEVERLLGLCRSAAPNSSARSFQDIFRQFGKEKAPPGFVGDSDDQIQLANGRRAAAETDDA